jgi:adenine-specific DNA-methyltransferase
VDLVFIDPPYNTGNEGWCYSDGVNSPIMKEWLSTNPVDGDDMLRHDKWLCMMWPRLVLLRELMSERGSASGSRWTTTRCTGRGWCWMRFLVPKTLS